MAGVLYFRKHSSRKTFVQAGSPPRTYFLSPFFVGIKSLAPDLGATHKLTLCAREATQSQGTGGTSVLPAPGRQCVRAFGTARLRQEGEIMDTLSNNPDVA